MWQALFQVFMTYIGEQNKDPYLHGILHSSGERQTLNIISKCGRLLLSGSQQSLVFTFLVIPPVCID